MIIPGDHGLTLLLLLSIVFCLLGSANNEGLPHLTTIDGRVYHPTVAYTLVNGSQMRMPRPYSSDTYSRRRAKLRKPLVPTPPSKPGISLKKKVGWYEGSKTFALQASVDSRLLIRRAPIPAAGTPWPLPQHYRPSDIVYVVKPKTFKFYSAGESCDILTQGFIRIAKNIFGDIQIDEDTPEDDTLDYGWSQELSEIKFMNVTVLKECTKYPTLEADESYDLEVKRSGASIIAREIWGALRGLETFSQLVYQDDFRRYVVNRTSIHDYPRFPHRGILLDSARHYLNKETIIKNLEAMAQNKMNVFHWHMTDDQSFPFQSVTFPNLTKMGAYDEDHIYTHADVAEIVEEARLRGIRVIPEFDTPGHTFSWGFGQDYLLTPCYDYLNKPDGYFGPMNPILKSTYNFLFKFFREVLSVFPDKYVHLGGDEVPFDCWSSNPQIMNFIRRNNLTDIRDVLSLYTRKLLDLVTRLGKEREEGSGYITWQEVVDNGVRVKPDTIVQVWMGDASDVERITSMGLRVIYSTCWYLDYISYGQDWDKYYRCEQISEHLDEYRLRNESLLIGGEACLWMEYADDSNVLSRLWPRASAVAERLWSNKKVKDEVAAAPRIEEQRCRMLRRGLGVGVASGPGYCKHYKKVHTDGAQSAKKKEGGFFWHRESRTEEAEIGRQMVHAPPQDKTQSSQPQQVYVVDMNAMYLVPVLLVVLLCCIMLLSIAQDPKSRFVAILTYPVSGSAKRSVKGLMYIFLIFAFVWCIWTAPIWMNAWESQHKHVRGE